MTKNIVAAIDFSPVSELVLGRAAAEARAFAARLWLLHVAAPEPDFVGYDAGPVGVRQQVAQHLREDHQRLQEHAQSLRQGGLDATALLVQGPTIETILREASKLAADLIVLGSHGRGVLGRTLLGSVSEGVLRKTAIPVLIVPSRAAAR